MVPMHVAGLVFAALAAVLPGYIFPAVALPLTALDG